MRTDVHSPTNLVTEDYEFVACGDFGAGDEPGYSPLAHGAAYLLAEGWRMGENHSAGGCYHCGAHIRYYAILKHLPSHTLIRVGETCLDNRFERATADFQRLRKQAQLDREQHRVKQAREAWQAEHPAEFAFLADYNEAEGTDGHYDGFYSSLWRTLGRYGNLTDKQLAALQRSIERKAQWAAERVEAEADAPAPTAVVEGRIEVTGEVLSVKDHETAFGVRLVMTVRDDRGFKVWGTVPAAITAVERGDRVKFTATVEKSDRDDTFGFFKRPANADYIDQDEDGALAAEQANELAIETRYADVKGEEELAEAGRL